MLEPHHSQFVVRVETMSDAERRVADEQAAHGVNLRGRHELRLFADLNRTPWNS